MGITDLFVFLFLADTALLAVANIMIAAAFLKGMTNRKE